MRGWKETANDYDGGYEYCRLSLWQWCKGRDLKGEEAFFRQHGARYR